MKTYKNAKTYYYSKAWKKWTAETEKKIWNKSQKCYDVITKWQACMSAEQRPNLCYYRSEFNMERKKRKEWNEKRRTAKKNETKTTLRPSIVK